MINMQLHKFDKIDCDQIYAPFKSFLLNDISAIESAIKNPKTIYTEKKQLPLWTFYTPKKEFIIFNKYGKPMGDSENFDFIEILQVEYDANKMEIADFKRKFSKYTYYLYTTWSHDKFNVSFRVILPLEQKLPVGFFKSKDNVSILSDVFRGVDKTAFQAFHKQKIPACHIDNLSKYEYHINKGINFDVDYDLMEENYLDFMEVQTRLKSTARISLDDNDSYYNIKGLYVPKFMEDCVKDKCDSIMSDINFNVRKTGVVHSTLLTVYGKMSTVGFEPFEIIRWMKDRAPTEAHKEIEAFYHMN